MSKPGEPEAGTELTRERMAENLRSLNQPWSENMSEANLQRLKNQRDTYRKWCHEAEARDLRSSEALLLCECTVVELREKIEELERENKRLREKLGV